MASVPGWCLAVTGRDASVAAPARQWRRAGGSAVDGPHLRGAEPVTVTVRRRLVNRGGADDDRYTLGVQLFVVELRRGRGGGGHVLAGGRQGDDVRDLALPRARDRLELLADPVRHEVADDRH